MSRDDRFEFTLDEESEKRLFELLTDVDVSKTPSFSIKDKHGNEAEYVKVVRCKDCKRSETDRNGIPYCTKFWRFMEYCSSGKRKEE